MRLSYRPTVDPSGLPTVSIEIDSDEQTIEDMIDYFRCLMLALGYDVVNVDAALGRK
jgi:hypothetical protein